jgi:hypothetical protein
MASGRSARKSSWRLFTASLDLRGRASARRFQGGPQTPARTNSTAQPGCASSRYPSTTCKPFAARQVIHANPSAAFKAFGAHVLAGWLTCKTALHGLLVTSCVGHMQRRKGCERAVLAMYIASLQDNGKLIVDAGRRHSAYAQARVACQASATAVGPCKQPDALPLTEHSTALAPQKFGTQPHSAWPVDITRQFSSLQDDARPLVPAACSQVHAGPMQASQVTAQQLQPLLSSHELAGFHQWEQIQSQPHAQHTQRTQQPCTYSAQQTIELGCA